MHDIFAGVKIDWCINTCSLFCQVSNKLGFGGIEIAVKCHKAPDLQLLRQQVSSLRSSFAVPIHVATRESTGKGDVEQAVNTWPGQFRTSKCQPGESIGLVLPNSHPVPRWCAFWAAGVLDKSAANSHKRTVFEYACGHRTRAALA